MANLKTVNRWAKLSCDKWNKCGLLRQFYRMLYRHAAQARWKAPVARQLTQQYQDAYYYLDTYPWPYKEAKFADWEENDVTGSYTLITDQSNFVVKHCTSYCAWKIFESTGRWPKRTTHRRYDAKFWQDFLSEAGYDTIVTELQQGHRYVGIREHDDSEFGEVVWFERKNEQSKDNRPSVIVSTYRNKKYFCGTVNPREYLWVQIV